MLHFTSLARNERNPLQMRVWCDFGRFSAHFFFFFDFGTAWSPIRIKIGYLGGPQENPDKTSPKAPKNRPDKNSGFGPLQDQGVQGIIGGPTLATLQPMRWNVRLTDQHLIYPTCKAKVRYIIISFVTLKATMECFRLGCTANLYSVVLMKFPIYVLSRILELFFFLPLAALSIVVSP